MNFHKLEQLIELIDDLVNESKGQSWREKLKSVLDTADSIGLRGSVVEFLSWDETAEQEGYDV